MAWTYEAYLEKNFRVVNYHASENPNLVRFVKKWGSRGGQHGDNKESRRRRLYKKRGSRGGEQIGRAHV